MPLACHTPEQTRLYEQGYPHMVRLVDGHKDDKKPAVAATRVFREYYGVYDVAWPRRVAHAFARASAAFGGSWDGEAVVKAAGAPGDVTPDEACALVRKRLEPKAVSYGFYHELATAFVLEAIAGTDPILDAIVAGLEALPKKRWAGDADGGSHDPVALLAYATGFLRLRARDPQTKRLEALYQATVKSGAAPGEHTVRGALDLALHGTEGAKRALAGSDWQYWHYYLMVDDPAVHLARLADSSKSDWVPEPRILWLAGEAMFPVYTSKKALRQGKRLPRILEGFAMIDHDAVVALMVDCIDVKAAGDVPRRYVEENRARIAKQLERLAKGTGPLAVKAKALRRV